MDYRERRRDDTQLLLLQGKITIGSDLDLRRATRTPAAPSPPPPPKKFIIDLYGITEVDATAAKDFVLALLSIVTGGDQLRIINVPKDLREEITRAGLDIQPSEDEAYESLRR